MMRVPTPADDEQELLFWLTGQDGSLPYVERVRAGGSVWDAIVAFVVDRIGGRA